MIFIHLFSKFPDHPLASFVRSFVIKSDVRATHVTISIYIGKSHHLIVQNFVGEK